MDIHQNLPENELLRLLRCGDMQAFDVLYRRYSQIIYGNILRFLKDETVAEDLLQDVFVRIWENRLKIDPEQSFAAFLFTCSRNITFNFKRRLKLEMESAVQLAYGAMEGENTIDRALDSKEAMLWIEQILNKLPSQRQKIFRLSKLEGKSYQEIAEEMGISVSTVRDHIVKANKFIRSTALADNGLSALLLAFLLFSTN
ncbi:RNA polymerase sigma-70 factor [Sphingobacterium sp. N143]|uniref:RNA polymerase sigma-70 factor n=1 Tax=Sphingobacterium sp. N143 TaxID=2746727 RepID=UPI0025760B36|nr:RNA polymerase sigma-70 factor [Sphingobacterium sp. N143]MDM1295222.1 RNA polymerase sigma-70 factor [Sphingobacterium sp. N143]